jgi:hypothetical protein
MLYSTLWLIVKKKSRQAEKNCLNRPEPSVPSSEEESTVEKVVGENRAGCGDYASNGYELPICRPDLALAHVLIPHGKHTFGLDRLPIHG